MKSIIIGIVVVVLAAGGYAWWSKGQGAVEKNAVTETSGKYAGKKILFIDSYHEGYEWSDGVTRGIKSVLDPAGVTLEIVRMDTKRNTTEEFKLAAGAAARDAIERMKPDVLLVADDNAFKYVVQAYYKDAALPVAFSGLNWDASVYGAPYTNTTGMVEVSLTNQIIDQLKNYARGSRVGYLSADTETERKNLLNYGKLLGITFAKSYFVKTMAEWKTNFSKLQSEVDIVIFENNAGISDWNDAEAQAYAEKNTKVPVGTTNPWIMKFALLGITKIPEEQGEWQADAALKMLDGAAPSSIPLVKNKRGKLMVNLTLADKLGIVFSPSILKNAEVIK